MILTSWVSVVHATDFSSADYDLYAGDFNGDGRTDLLYISKTPDKASGIALADASGTPQIGFQSWPSNFLNIPWSNGSYKAIIGDFNGDHCADILLQSQTPGNSYVLLANCDPAKGPVGQIFGIAQAIAQNTFGIAWSADQHHLVAGDFDGDGKTDLLFQATSPSGVDAIVLADSSGGLFTRSSSHCGISAGPQQCWTDGYQGLKWSTQSALIYAGDFNGDGRSDLLLQARPTIVTIAYDVPFPVPVFAPESFALFLAQVADTTGAIIRTPNQLWGPKDLNADWSPLNSTVLVGDFNGDGRADVLLQSHSGNTLQLLLSSPSGQLLNATLVPGADASWNSSGHVALVGKFGNNSSASLYLQSTRGGGTSYLTSPLSGSGSATAMATALTVQAAASTASSPAAATAVGATQGAADVTPNGTGRYTLPLAVPRGTAGLTPQLALQYQSSVGNGLLGVGWGISGLSTITRCPQTVAQDGVMAPIQLTVSDQYCLDGQRLRLTSGTQGTDGSQYRTELETYALVKVIGNSASGPQTFQVWQKNGLIYQYGLTANSRIAITGTSTIKVWALERISDRASNYIYFYYQNSPSGISASNPDCPNSDPQAAGYRICKIQYTGNSGSSSVTPPYTLRFFYQARNAGEVLTGYYEGGLVRELTRLEHIELQYGSAATVVHKWMLGYDSTVTLSNLSRLSYMQECGASTCFPATTFSWSTQAMSNGLPTFSSTQTPDNGMVLV